VDEGGAGNLAVGINESQAIHCRIHAGMVPLSAGLLGMGLHRDLGLPVPGIATSDHDAGAQVAR
jgi:hypothetical protein